MFATLANTCKAVGAGTVTSNGFEAAGKTPEGPAGVVAVKFVVKRWAVVFPLDVGSCCCCWSKVSANPVTLPPRNGTMAHNVPTTRFHMIPATTKHSTILACIVDRVGFEKKTYKILSQLSPVAPFYSHE